MCTVHKVQGAGDVAYNVIGLAVLDTGCGRLINPLVLILAD